MKNTTLEIIKGYKVLFIPTNDSEMLIGSLLLSSESKETKNVYGISHLLEHCLLKSWSKFPSYNIDSELIKRSIHSNASTNYDYVWYYLLSDHQDLNFSIDYLTGIMCNPVFTKEVLDKEKKAVEQELKNYQQCPVIEMEKIINDTLTSDSKGNPSSLSANLDMKNLIKNLKKITPTVMKKYHSKVYNSDNMVFIICGNEKLKNSSFSQIKQNLKFKKKNYLKIPKIIYTPVKNTLVIHKTRLDNVKSNTWLTFSDSKFKGIKNEMILNLISTVLCSSVGSAIYKKIRVEKNWVYEINCNVETSPLMERVIITFSSNTSKVHLIVREIKKIISSFKLSNDDFNGYIRTMAKISKHQNCTLLRKGNNWAQQWVKYRELEIVPNVIKTIEKKELEQMIMHFFDFSKMLVSHQSFHKKIPKNISDLKYI